MKKSHMITSSYDQADIAVKPQHYMQIYIHYNSCAYTYELEFRDTHFFINILIFIGYIS